MKFLLYKFLAQDYFTFGLVRKFPLLSLQNIVTYTGSDFIMNKSLPQALYFPIYRPEEVIFWFNQVKNFFEATFDHAHSPLNNLMWLKMFIACVRSSHFSDMIKTFSSFSKKIDDIKKLSKSEIKEFVRKADPDFFLYCLIMKELDLLTDEELDWAADNLTFSIDICGGVLTQEQFTYVYNKIKNKSLVVARLAAKLGRFDLLDNKIKILAQLKYRLVYDNFDFDLLELDLDVIDVGVDVKYLKVKDFHKTIFYIFYAFAHLPEIQIKRYFFAKSDFLKLITKIYFKFDINLNELLNKESISEFSQAFLDLLKKKGV